MTRFGELHAGQLRSERGSVDLGAVSLQPASDAAIPIQRGGAVRRKGPRSSYPETAGDSRSTSRAADTPSRATEGLLVLLAEVAAVLSVALVAWSTAGLLAFLVAALVWRSKGLYSRRFSLSIIDDLGPLTLGAVVALAPVLVVNTEILALDLSATLLGVAAMLVAVVVARTVAYGAILKRRRAGRITYPTVIVGAGPVAVSLAERMQEHPESGLRPVGFLDETMAQSHSTPLLGSASDLPQIVQDNRVTDVVVGYGALPTADLVQILRSCDRLDVEIHVLPRLFEMHQLSAGSDHVWGLPLMRVRRTAHRAFTWRVKRLIDVVVAGAVLVVLAPLFALTALAVRLDLGKGIFFEQVRVGLDGQPVKVRKFRSMRDLPPGVESPWSVTSDDRLGRVGRIIRRYSIDELPQLLNILTGDMSLVGPRPERPEFVKQFMAEIPRYGDRHRVPVGLTGLAAVHGLRGDTSISERAYFDNLYIENWSLSLDIKILARTVVSVVRGTGA